MSQKSILVQTDPGMVEGILNTNLRGAIWGCKFVGKQMIKKKKRGCIINISSLLAQKAVVGTSVYAASKAGLLGKFCWPTKRAFPRSTFMISSDSNAK